jgi:hypothetical protein
VTRRVALTIVATAAVLVPGPVVGQASSPTETELQMERQQRRAILRPTPPPEGLERDVQEAAAEAEQRRRQDAIVRELQRPLPHRPDLDYDVKSGIQSQRLNDALRR